MSEEAPSAKDQLLHAIPRMYSHKSLEWQGKAAAMISKWQEWFCAGILNWPEKARYSVIIEYLNGKQYIGGPMNRVFSCNSAHTVSPAVASCP